MKAQRRFVSFFGLGSVFAAPLFYSYLREHPQICVPENEIDFFSQPKLYTKGLDWYESQFGKCEAGIVYGELSGYYLKNAGAASLIARAYPNAKLFAVVENPVVSVKVAYIEAMRDKLIPTKMTLAAFIKQYPEVLRAALYGQQLVQYYSYYSPNDLWVVTAADVREDPLGITKKAYDYLGVDNTYAPQTLRHLIVEEEPDPKKRPGLIKRTIKWLRSTVVASYRKIINRLLPTKEIPVETASQAARAMVIAPELETYLHNYYKADVAVLSRLLHRNLASEWGMDS